MYHELVMTTNLYMQLVLFVLVPCSCCVHYQFAINNYWQLLSSIGIMVFLQWMTAVADIALVTWVQYVCNFETAGH